MRHGARENIKGFCDGVRVLGVPDHENFETGDLFEAKNMKQARHWHSLSPQRHAILQCHVSEVFLILPPSPSPSARDLIVGTILPGNLVRPCCTDDGNIIIITGSSEIAFSSQKFQMSIS